MKSRFMGRITGMATAALGGFLPKKLPARMTAAGFFKVTPSLNPEPLVYRPGDILVSSDEAAGPAQRIMIGRTGVSAEAAWYSLISNTPGIFENDNLQSQFDLISASPEIFRTQGGFLEAWVDGKNSNKIKSLLAETKSPQLQISLFRGQADEIGLIQKIWKVDPDVPENLYLTGKNLPPVSFEFSAWQNSDGPLFFNLRSVAARPTKFFLPPAAGNLAASFYLANRHFARFLPAELRYIGAMSSAGGMKERLIAGAALLRSDDIPDLTDEWAKLFLQERQKMLEAPSVDPDSTAGMPAFLATESALKKLLAQPAEESSPPAEAGLAPVDKNKVRKVEFPPPIIDFSLTGAEFFEPGQNRPLYFPGPDEDPNSYQTISRYLPYNLRCQLAFIKLIGGEEKIP